MPNQQGDGGAMDARLLEVIRMQTEIAKLGMDLGGVMALVAERAQRLTGAFGAAVELAEEDDMVYRAASGAAELHLGMRLKRSSSLSGRCIHEEIALQCDDSDTDPRVDREACRLIGLRSMIVVPLHELNASCVAGSNAHASTPSSIGTDVITLPVV